MSRPAILIENIGKKYLISHQREKKYPALREIFTDGLKKMGKKITLFSTQKDESSAVSLREEFWALKGIDFEVAEGDRVGIIGRNGSGKSTLLKILSRITEPTEGKVRIRGRVASLLEVGTGFHPELTGRENIYLNGAILGMGRAEIKSKFDEIVAFAEVDKFLDTPVKRYSSGMYVRLAFAVAAHVEPDVLIIDEVLAVGDAQFQRKCMGKMQSIGDSGRTIFFVSHNMASISQLCDKGVVLDRGRIRAIGDIDDAVGNYLAIDDEEMESPELEHCPHRRGTGEARFIWGQVFDKVLNPCRRFSMGDDIVLQFRLRIERTLRNKQIRFVLGLRNSDGIQLCKIMDSDSHFLIDNAQDGEEISIHFSDVRFYPDTYFISLWTGSESGIEMYDSIEDCLSFRIIDGGELTARQLNRNAGLLFVTPEWKRAVL